MVKEHAVKAGYTVTREQHLQPHYVKTLDTWARNLEAHKDEAIEITNEVIYERFLKYLDGCADLFRQGYTDVAQFTLEKAPA
jgi:cyclopropane-fatty-acyl-phospholipid synthase